MALHIIIDGYNLLRQSEILNEPDRLNLQHARERMLERLAVYRQHKGHQITVVFDGANAPAFSPQQYRYRGIRTLFSRNGELADTVIKRMVTREREKALVVTSDREIIRHAISRKASVIDSPAFEKKVTGAVAGADDDGEARYQGWTPSTQKKGPARRLPRQKRRSLAKIKKL